MHRAADSSRAARGLSVDLGEHAPEIAALGEVVRMAAVSADGEVTRLGDEGEGRRRRLLTDRQVHGAAHLLLRVGIRDGLLDHPDPHHGAVEVEQGGAIGHGMNQ